MYTYKDLLNDTAVRCRSEEEFDALVTYLQMHGNHEKTVKWNSDADNMIVDVLECENPERNITSGLEDWYREECPYYVKIVNFEDFGVFEPVDADKFVNFLLD